MKQRTFAALGVAMAMCVPGIAAAGSNDMDVIVDGTSGAQTRSIAVSVSDLDLASAHDMRRADSRLVRASKSVCGYVDGSIMPSTKGYRQCFGTAIEGARADLNTLAQRLS